MRRFVSSAAALLVCCVTYAQDENDDRALTDCLRATWAKRFVCERVDDSINCLVESEERLTNSINACIESDPSLNPDAITSETASF